jgi:hypothetical protein
VVLADHRLLCRGVSGLPLLGLLGLSSLAFCLGLCDKWISEGPLSSSMVLALWNLIPASVSPSAVVLDWLSVLEN